MRVLLSFVLLWSFIAGIFANPVDIDKSRAVDATPAAPAFLARQDDPPRCEPCNRHFDSCMNHWNCWVPGANCKVSCRQEICQKYTNCRLGCGYKCS